MRSLQKQQGFTLIELLAVVLLVGVAAAVVTVSVGTGGRSYELRNSSRFLFNGMTAALEEAVITQQQLGLRFDVEQDNNGADIYLYQWLILDAAAREWKMLENEDFYQTTLVEGIKIELNVEGDTVVIGAQNKDSFFSLKQNSDSTKPLLQPDIYFLASGEMPEFTITLSDDVVGGGQYIITGNMVGQMSLKEPHEQKE